MRPTQALLHLMAGNERFRTGQSAHCGTAPSRRVATARGQAPVAAVVGCADSRVAPEAVFDSGLGEIFAIRVDGNTVSGRMVLGSLEYAIEQLDVPVVMVLGHRGCGAVGAACAHRRDGQALDGQLRAVVDLVLDGMADLPADVDVDEAATANVAHQVELLLADPGPVGTAARAGRVRVVGALYDLTTGEVELTTNPFAALLS